MANSKKEDLLDPIKPDSLYQPLLSPPQPKAPSIPYAVSLQNQNNIFDSEIETLFRLYRYVIYVYLFISLMQLIKGGVDFVASPSGDRLFPMIISFFTFWIWFVGNHSMLFRSARYTFRFQGLLILFMLYHAVVCSQIVQDSYIVIPNLTLSSFGLNAVFGILIPVLVYYRADELRLLLEQNNPKSALKL